MAGQPPSPEDQRLLQRARLVVIGVVQALLAIVVLGVLFGPPLDEGEAAILVVLIPALTGALLPLVGIRSILNRGD